MHIDRKAQWAVRQSGLPTIVRRCPDCSSTRHHPSGKIRVNANGKLLDVWLLLSCEGCDRTSKAPVHERVHLSALKPARREAYEANSPAMVHELAMSASLATRNGYRLDWTGTWALETDTPSPALDGPGSLTVRVAFELPAPVRLERLLTLGLGLSRSGIRHLVAAGRVQLPAPVDGKVHQDFEFTVAGLAPAGPGRLVEAPHPVAQQIRQDTLVLAAGR